MFWDRIRQRSTECGAAVSTGDIISLTMKIKPSVIAACLAVLPLLASRPPAQNAPAELPPFCGTETDVARKPTNGEPGERAAFICRAMDQWRQQVRDEVRATQAKGGSQFAIQLAEIVPFSDWDFYYVKRDGLSWTPNAGGPSPAAVLVPLGFVTDLASIPRVFWEILPPQGRYAYAAVIHDYLYWTQTRPRNEADDILKLAMQDSKVDAVTVASIYEAVRAFGQAAWNANAQRRKSGECRILDMTNSPPLVARWSDWRMKPNVFRNDLCQQLQAK